MALRRQRSSIGLRILRLFAFYQLAFEKKRRQQRFSPQSVEMSSQLRFLESFFIICWLLSLFIAVVNKLLMALNSL